MYSRPHAATDHRHRLHLAEHLPRGQDHQAAALGHRGPVALQGPHPQLHPRYLGGSYRVRRHQQELLQQRAEVDRRRQVPARRRSDHRPPRQQGRPRRQRRLQRRGKTARAEKLDSIQGGQRQDRSQHPRVLQVNSSPAARGQPAHLPIQGSRQSCANGARQGGAAGPSQQYSTEQPEGD